MINHIFQSASGLVTGGPSLHDNGPHHKHIGWFVRVHKGQSECLLQSNVHDLDRVVRQMPLVACLTRRTHVDGWLCKPCMPYWMSLRTRILLGLPLFRSIYRRLWLQFLRRVLQSEVQKPKYWSPRITKLAIIGTACELVCYARQSNHKCPGKRFATDQGRGIFPCSFA